MRKPIATMVKVQKNMNTYQEVTYKVRVILTDGPRIVELATVPSRSKHRADTQCKALTVFFQTVGLLLKK